jgi:hypothetical protein
MWTELMGERMRVRRRLSRIHYRGRFFQVSARAVRRAAKTWSMRRDLLSVELSAGATRSEGTETKLGSARIWAPALRNLLPPSHGNGLGRACSQISAEWAAQQIKGLSLVSPSAAHYRADPATERSSRPWSIAFAIRRTCLGEVWEDVARMIGQKGGGMVRMGEPPVRIEYAAGRVTCATTQSNEGPSCSQGEPLHLDDAGELGLRWRAPRRPDQISRSNKA